MNDELKNKIKNIKALVLDVDGVLTNGKINLDDQGRELKMFDVQDGYGLVLWRKAGYKTAIISARASEAVTVRAKDLKIDKVYQDAYPKLNAYEETRDAFDLSDEQMCFIGDDLPDKGVLGRVGFSVTVPNGVEEVKAIADYVTQRPGGHGAVREVVELILKTRGQWSQICDAHG